MKKRLAFISEHASPLALLGGVDSGGQNVYVAELSRQLVALGYDIDIFTRRESAEQQRVVNWQPGIRVIHIDAGPAQVIEKEQLLVYMDEFAADMLRFIRTHAVSYLMVHAHFFMSGVVAAQIKKILRIPYVITFHALGLVRRMHQKEKDRFPEERIAIEKFLMKDADHVIAECPQDKDDMLNHYDADPERIKVIPCGFCCKELYPVDKRLARAKLGLKDDEKVVLQLGRMVARKGIDNVIRAMGCMKKKGIKAKLLIVGGNVPTDGRKDPELERLLAIAKDEEVTDNVVFAGHKQRDELKYYYSASDVFVTTPWYEPFGITPLEAMACAVPVVGAAVGGIKHTVLNGKTGLLVPPDHPVLLAEKIGLLLTDPQLSVQMGKRGLRRVKQYFTWEKVAKASDTLYRRLTNTSKPSLLQQLPRLLEHSIQPLQQVITEPRSALTNLP